MKRLFKYFALFLVFSCTACISLQSETYEVYKDLLEIITIDNISVEFTNITMSDSFSNSIGLQIKITNKNIEAKNIQLTNAFVLRESNGAIFELSDQTKTNLENDLSCSFYFSKSIPTSPNEENYSIQFSFNNNNKIKFNFYNPNEDDLEIISIKYSVNSSVVFTKEQKQLQSIEEYAYLNDSGYFKVSNWYLDESLSQLVNNSTLLTKDTVLYGKEIKMFSTTGSSAITLTGINYSPTNGNLIIPSSVYGSTVEKLNVGFLSSSDNVTTITIPKGIALYSNSFNYCTKLVEIIYEGSLEDWNNDFYGNLRDGITVTFKK